MEKLPGSSIFIDRDLFNQFFLNQSEDDEKYNSYMEID